MTANKTVSIGQIAGQLGISAMTVSRMLNAKSPPVRADGLKAYKAVRLLADELGYRKPAAPRAMVTGKYNAITVLGSTQWFNNHMPQNRLRGLQESADEHALSLNFVRMDDQNLVSKKTAPDILRNMASDGLLVNYVTGYPKQLDAILHRYHIPAIWMNSKHITDAIYLDDFKGSSDATEYLLSLGHRRIGYWHLGDMDTSKESHYSLADRRCGYVDAMKRAGVPVMEMSPGKRLEYDQYAMFLSEWLGRKERPTAVITYNPPHAMAVMMAALRLGLRVPEDVSILHFHDEVRMYQFTAMHVPELTLGRQAVDMLIKKISCPEKSLPSVALPLSMMLKDKTCAPPRK